MVEQKNINSLVDFFSSGCKGDGSLKLGVEIEHFVVDRRTKESVSYYGENGIEKILFELSSFYNEKRAGH